MQPEPYCDVAFWDGGGGVLYEPSTSTPIDGDRVFADSNNSFDNDGSPTIYGDGVRGHLSRMF
jgi:hypothetical protein